MKVVIYSEKGNGKKRCEDAALFEDTIVSDSYFEVQTDQGFLAAIADGVGGNAGGDYASRYVLDKLTDISMTDLSVEYVRQFLSNINDNLLQYASSMSGKENMATTLTGMMILSEKSYTFHIGNTRGYCLQGNYLKQFTDDQTTYQWLLNMGQIESARRCNKNEITHCFGGGSSKYGSAVVVKESNILCACKRILLTTDGIHEYVTIDELEDFAVGEMSEKTFRILANRAHENGSSDDKTIVVVDREL